MNLEERKERLRKIRLPMIEALRVAAECPDCAATIALFWKLDGMRSISIDTKLEPCLQHSPVVAKAMAASEVEVLA